MEEDFLKLNGYCYLRNTIDISLLDELHDLICELVLNSAKRLNHDSYENFINMNIPYNELPHKGLINLYLLDYKCQQIVVDALKVSNIFYKIITSKNLLKSLSNILKTSESNLIVNSPIFRVDLPSKYSKVTKKIELPAHQESSYFKKDIDSVNGSVIWLPLYDCSPDNGSLIVYSGSHKSGELKHTSKYIIPEQKKHKRFTISDELYSNYRKVQLETRRGDCAIQHFHLAHKSGTNLSNSVRYTIILRTCDIMSPEFIPGSWI